MSHNVIARFCCTVFFLIAWLLRDPQHLIDGSFSGAMTGAAIITALLALMLRERFRGPVLNRWDEALGYLGLAALGQAIPFWM